MDAVSHHLEGVRDPVVLGLSRGAVVEDFFRTPVVELVDAVGVRQRPANHEGGQNLG
jgi:hypothetical protein